MYLRMDITGYIHIHEEKFSISSGSVITQLVLLCYVLSPPTTTGRGRISFWGTSSRVTYQCPPTTRPIPFLFLTFYPFSGSTLEKKRAQSFISYILYCCRASKTPSKLLLLLLLLSFLEAHTYHQGDLSSIDTRTLENQKKENEMEATDTL